MICSCSSFFFWSRRFLVLVLMKDKPMRLLCHVYFFFFISMTLFRCEWASHNNNMYNQLHQNLFFVHSFAFVSPPSRSTASTPICTSLHTVIQSQYIYLFIYVYVLTNDALTQKVIFLLCPIHLTFITNVWFVRTSTCSTIHMRIIVNKEKKRRKISNETHVIQIL